MSHDRIRVSKFLSYVLRHRPESIGLALDAQGWANIDELIGGARRSAEQLTLELIKEVVRTNEKQRFAISEDGLRIRANQGHSIDVDLELQPLQPPDLLYHGTAAKSLKLIKQAGLLPQKRQYVHLSLDVATATKVGSRHGVPVALEILARKMHDVGHVFYRSANAVWLCNEVPPTFIKFPSLPND